MNHSGHDAVRDQTEDALLLREFCHRTAGEVSSALATLRLVAACEPPGSRRRLTEQAIGRLEGFGALNRLLGHPVAARVQVGAAVSDICVALGTGRPGAGASRMELDLASAWMGGPAARRLLLIAAELVGDGVACAMQDRAGRLRVALRADGDEVALTVEDDGPGPRVLAAGDGQVGRLIAVDLVGRSTGTMTVVTGRRGTRVTVNVPAGLERCGDDPAEFEF